jgi:threonine/homoserine/homoserine lactone efflux protein
MPLLEFAAAVFLLIATPGPGVMGAAGMGAAYGFGPGVRFITGLCLGQLVVIALVVSGIAAAVCQCRSKIPQKCRSNFPHFRDLVTSQIRGLS